MINSFLIFFITIKVVEIALILQGVSINTHSAGKRKKIYSIYFSNSFSSPLPHTPPFLSLFQKKSILKEVEKKEKKTFSTLSLSLITTHKDTSHLYLYWKNKHKNIRKGSKKKRMKIEKN